MRRVGHDTPVSRASSSEPEDQFSTVEASIAHAISSDISKYPRLDKKSQEEVVAKYRQLDEKLRSEGLDQCPYSAYAGEFVRYSILFVLFLTTLHYSYYILSGLFLGLLWHLLAFTVHDAGCGFSGWSFSRLVETESQCTPHSNKLTRARSKHPAYAIFRHLFSILY